MQATAYAPTAPTQSDNAWCPALAVLQGAAPTQSDNAGNRKCSITRYFACKTLATIAHPPERKNEKNEKNRKRTKQMKPNLKKKGQKELGKKTRPVPVSSNGWRCAPWSRCGPPNPRSCLSAHCAFSSDSSAWAKANIHHRSPAKSRALALDLGPGLGQRPSLGLGPGSD